MLVYRNLRGTIMRLRSPNRVLRNINTEGGEKKKNRKMCVFLYGYFQGVRAAESGIFICCHNSPEGSLLSVENVQFQRNVEHTSFPPLWAGCRLKWWRCVCGKTVKVF